MKKIAILFILILNFFIFGNISFAQEDITIDNNIISKAFQERKEKVLRLINGGELEVKINNLKKELEKLKINKKLNKNIIQKIEKELEELNNKQKTLKENLKKAVLNSKEFEEIYKKYKENIKLKKDLIKELNKTIEENKIKEEKINVLLEKYLKQKGQNLKKEKQEKIKKLYILIFFSIISLIGYLITTFLTKKGKIDSKKSIYINFLILFSYIIFLIWFLFYLYPQLSIFLIFISGYLLVVNSHLVASFIGSIVTLQRFKIGDIIKFGNNKGQIIKITPLHIEILPITDKEGILVQKPIIVPHINILKENIIKDKTPKFQIHKFRLTIRIDSGVDVMQFVEFVENNILNKFLHNKLNSIFGSEDTYRITFEHTNFGHITVVFIWRDEDPINKKIERKIIGHFQNLLNEKKKELEEKILTDKKI